MNEIPSTIRKYPRPDKRTRNNVEFSLLTTPSATQRTSRVISEIREEKIEPAEVNDFIKSQLNLVSKSHIERWINGLASFHNRHSKSIYIHQVAEWLKKELVISGYRNNSGSDDKEEGVYFHSFNDEGVEMRNVICTKKGRSNDFILICGHYDTVLGDNVEDTVSRAPGANDNASGVSAILEIARILFSLDLSLSTRFVFFSGEEQGLRGSEYYSDLIARKKENLHLVINLDMVGQPGFLMTDKTIQIDVDKKFNDKPSCNMMSNNDEDSDEYATLMQKIATSYTNLVGQKGPAFASDYCPFEARGYVIVGAYDGSAENENPHYHHSSDVPENLDIEFLVSVTKMVLATIMDINGQISSK
ncbi:M28 family metallopeptidase [Candidatus Nitrosocosmicus hydrocola]|uniref:M28 family metallopeptidase n=1 Tax=Candidatus Nitrosocosmicus hydrocola TaxID=1826872 RepID=UPI0011E60332|nr:M28 family metallopeptidase [Candidatus Nitrosocosmicus hydrocola]